MPLLLLASLDRDFSSQGLLQPSSVWPLTVSCLRQGSQPGLKCSVRVWLYRSLWKHQIQRNYAFTPIYIDEEKEKTLSFLSCSCT